MKKREIGIKSLPRWDSGSVRSEDRRSESSERVRTLAEETLESWPDIIRPHKATCSTSQIMLTSTIEWVSVFVKCTGETQPMFITCIRKVQTDDCHLRKPSRLFTNYYQGTVILSFRTVEICRKRAGRTNWQLRVQQEHEERLGKGADREKELHQGRRDALLLLLHMIYFCMKGLKGVIPCLQGPRSSKLYLKDRLITSSRKLNIWYHRWNTRLEC